MNSKQTVCETTKQDSRINGSAEKWECAAVRGFRSSNDRVQLEKDFYVMIRNANTLVADLKSVIDICPDILTSHPQNNPGNTPLHEACRYGRSKEVIELLVRLRPDMLQIADSIGRLPLHYMLHHCELSVVKLMVDKYPLSVQVQEDIQGRTPLHYACNAQCSFEVIEFLVQAYPQALQIQDKYDNHTPLHLAICHRCSNEVVELLVRQNPNMLQVTDSHGHLPLFYVLPHYELSVIKLVIDACPLSVQFQNKSGSILLHYACEMQCSFDVIEFLVQSYPQALQIKNKDGLAPLDLAIFYGCSNEVVEFLVRQSPDALQVADFFGGNLPLHNVCQSCELSVVKLMVDTYPLSVQVRNKSGQTPLYRACEHGCLYEVIEYLVQLYPQVLQIRDSNGCTPYHNACRYHKDVLVIQLLYTAFPLAARWKCYNGKTPIAAAYEHGKSMEVTEYVAYECWPVACPLLYMSQHWQGEKIEKCLEDATMETVAALIDVAFHVKHILPVTVTAHIAESVMPCVDKCKAMKSQTKQCHGQRCGLLLGTLNHHTNLDRCTVLTIMKSKELRCLLQPESGHDELQELIDNVIRMNRADRAYYAEDPENKRQGMKVLESTSQGLSGLFYHIRENPLLCKQCLS